MRTPNVLARFALALLIIGGLVSVGFAADKVKSDKERIVALEKQVDELTGAVSDLSMDLAGAHQWAMSVNARLQILENRGPVARR